MNTNPKAVCRNCLKYSAAEGPAQFSDGTWDGFGCLALPGRANSEDHIPMHNEFSREIEQVHFCGMGVWLVELPPDFRRMGSPTRKLWHELEENDEIVERNER